MDQYAVHQLTTARHDDLVREAEQSRAVRATRDVAEEARPARTPKGTRVRRLRLA